MSLTPEQLEALRALPTAAPVTKTPAAPTALTSEQLTNLRALPPAPSAPVDTVQVEEKNEPSFFADVGRVVADTAENLDPVNLIVNVKQMAEEAKGMLGFENKAAQYEVLSKLRTKQNMAPLQALTGEAVFTPEGEIKDTETTAGTVLGIAPYIAGGWRVAIMKKLKDLSTFRKGIVGATAVTQILADPDTESVFNVAEELLPPNLQNDFVSFMAIDEDDTQLEKRLKLVGEEMTLGVLGEVVGGAAKLTWWSSKLFGKQVSKLTNTEKGQIMMEHLKAAKDISTKTVGKGVDVVLKPVTAAVGKLGSVVSPRTKDSYFDEAEFTTDLGKTEGRIVYEETPEAAKQMAQQNGNSFSSKLKRMTNQFFQSRGYWSKNAYNAYENSMHAQRQQIAKAENTANRLQKHLDDIVETNEGPQVLETVQSLFDEGLDFTFAKGLSFEDQVSDVVNQFNLPKNIATELVNARNQIDGLSKDLVNSSAVPDDLKEAIVEGAGKYLRRSYRLYEDKGYVPSDDVTEDARDFLIKQFQNNDPDLSEEFAFNKADTFLKDLLTDNDLKDTANYLERIRKVNTAMLTGRKDIPDEIKAFMGEIREPSENIILTVSKMTKLAETNKFFGTLKDLGESGGYIRKAESPDPDGMYGEKITGTNSELDGMYTSKEMLTAIKDKQGKIGKLRENETYRKYLGVQSTVQKWKTVYSHMTHMKNLTGGAVMSAANGVNPLRKDTFKIFSNLRNSIVQGGDAALDESYEKYLRLGIINTNVQVNEYRELLETGYRAQKTEGFKWVEESVPYGRDINKQVFQKGETALKRVEDIYVATDDYYKINTFLSELDTLKKANTGKPLDVLEAEAARITQNTYANYDRVPFGIKALKDLPFGSFVSFPAESIRVQVNILRQAGKEMASGNATLVARGTQRLAGMTVTNTAVGYSAAASAKLMFGNDDEKAKAAHVLTEKPWSKVAPRIWHTDEETGDMLYFDTASHDPFTAVKDPLRIIRNELFSKNLEGDALNTRILDVSLQAAASIVKPFVSQTILADLLTDVGSAVISPTGRSAKGKELFPEGMSFGEKAANVGYLVFDRLAPGTVTSAVNLIDVASGERNRSTGKTKDLDRELMKNLTSVNLEKLDVADALLFAVNDYKGGLKNLVSSSPDYQKTTEELQTRYRARQRAKYKVEQELYRKIVAAETLVGKEQTMQMLFDAKMSKSQIEGFASGVSMAEPLSKSKMLSIVMKTPVNSSEELEELQHNLSLDYQSFSNVPLHTPEYPTEEALESMERMRKSTGGKISKPVANAPSEPDERINKITGLPYNESAGPAYMDIEDPLRALNMAAGGRVQKNVGGKVLNALKRNCN